MLKRLIESFKDERTYQHCVISLTSLGVVGSALQKQGIEVYSLSFNFALADFKKVFLLIKIIRVFSPDIVQTWMYHADLIGGISSYFAGYRKIIWGIRVTNIHSSSIMTLWIMKFCAFLSSIIPSKIICVAEAARQSHIQNGYDASKMIVINNGLIFSDFNISEDNRRTLSLQCCFPHDCIVVGCVGRFDPIKDHHNFVFAAGLLAKQNARVFFLMIGHNLTFENKVLSSWIDQTNHRDRFVLLGVRSDIATCLSLMDVFCLSSSIEGFPNALSEAMAMALPCVSTDVGDVSILLGDTGIIVPKENSEALANALSHVIELSSEQRQEMGERGKERVFRNFSIEKAKKSFESVYREITASC